ncbi:leucine-rich repeat domain-containing protein [Phanerochaete sordida]|uniref:Leucine-rich repeat domain-containing protein n=1 Tax=Phanerochaete sordida TaxID=48140 RepID=A0A9P3G6W4_9APHY|nr:leucine-rich repeat domain-containing protein [Phanerochaete sordida]
MSSYTRPPNRFGAPSPPPTSSPASSPSFGPCDSSPVSSPPPEPLALSPPPSPGPSHPFAASTKAVRPPRIYEKRTPRGGFELDSSLDHDVFSLDDSPPRTRHTTSTAVPHDPLAGDANAAWTPPSWEKRAKSDRTLSTASEGSSDFSSIAPARLFTSEARAIPYAFDPDAVSLGDDDSETGLAHPEISDKADNEARDTRKSASAGLAGTPLAVDRAPATLLPAFEPTAGPVSRSRPFTRSTTVPANAHSSHPMPLLASGSHSQFPKSPSTPGSSSLSTMMSISPSSIPHDPLAGDANPAWTPPAWEKKTRAKEPVRALSVASSTSSGFLSDPPSQPYASRARPAPYAYDPDAIDLSDDEMDASPVYRSREQVEQEVWDKAIEHAINESNGRVNLDNSGLIGTPLTRIPPSIADLGSLVVLQSRTKPTSEFSPRSRPFMRSATVPSNPLHHKPFLAPDDHPRLLKSPSMAQLKPPEDAEPESVDNSLFLSLAQNQITRLPVELFRLQGLVELNLRGNRIAHMPPQIGQLANLRVLVLSQNKLTYLPAEMLDMRLTTLSLQGNPWLPPPAGPSSSAPPADPPASAPPTVPSASAPSAVPPAVPPASAPLTTRTPTTPTTTHFTLPSLTELCLRALLAPSPAAQHPTAQHPSTQDPSTQHPTAPHRETLLEHIHALPLPDDYPRWLLDDLRACCPRAVAAPLAGSGATHGAHGTHGAAPAKRVRRSASFGAAPSETGYGLGGTRAGAGEGGEGEDGETHPSIGTCRSPVHGGAARVFVRCAEERLAWACVVGGLPAGVEGGVPVLWRGCAGGCLDFLGEV